MEFDFDGNFALLKSTKDENTRIIKQANENISIREVIESFSLFPSKEHPKTAYYYAINRQERTPSLLVNYVKNVAFDFGTGKQYDVVSIVQEIK